MPLAQWLRRDSTCLCLVRNVNNHPFFEYQTGLHVPGLFHLWALSGGGGGGTTTGLDATNPLAICRNLGGVLGGVGWRVGSGGYWRFGQGVGGSQGGGAYARPATNTCIPPEGVRVWEFGGMDA